MKRTALLCMIFALCAIGIAAQRAGSMPADPTTRIPQSAPSLPRGVRSTDGGTAFDGLSDSMANLKSLTAKQQIVSSFAQTIYRKPTPKELNDIAPDPTTVDRYREFLSRGGAGIFRLVPDHKCSEGGHVISASDECSRYTMPGAGSSFSFRVGTYRIRDLADIYYDDGKLKISGMMLQGAFVDLGDTPIENVSLASDGLKYLVDIKLVTEFEAARAMDSEIVAGVTSDGYVYKRSLPALVNETYAMRIIAYRGRLMRVVRGVSYNEFDYDKRRDMIVAFRIVERDADGSLTIIWMPLVDREAPKLKPPRDDTKSAKTQ